MDNKIWMAIALATITVACEPLEDTSWIHNSHVQLIWPGEEGVDGQRPVEVDSFFVHYYSQTGEQENKTCHIMGNKGEYDIKTDCYDVLVTHNHPYLNREQRFKTSAIVLPTTVNEQAEIVVTSNPQEMIYAGVVRGSYVHFDYRSTIYVNMKRMFKKMNFLVTISDSLELQKKCTVDISGMTSKRWLWSGVQDEESQCLQIFDLVKNGRHLNTDKCLTSYKGSVLCLGTTGRNILHFYYTDAKGQERVAKYELTSYLADWNTEEVTVRININADNQDVFLEGWDEGDTTDFIFGLDYENNGEE